MEHGYHPKDLRVLLFAVNEVFEFVSRFNSKLDMCIYEY